MMNNQNETTIEIGPLDIRNILDKLRINLKSSSKENTANWDADMSKLVNLAHVDYLNQKDNDLAVETIAVISMAKKYGLKSAKKISVSFSRWKNDAPPSISSIINDEDEKYNAIKLMTTINADWVTNYAVEELLNSKSEPLQKELIYWGLNNSQSIAAYFESFTSKFKPESHSISPFIAVLKWSISNSCFSHKITTESPFPFIHKNIVCCINHIKYTKNNELGVKKTQIIIVSLQAASCDFIDVTTSINPTYLLSPTLANTLKILAAESKLWPKSTNIKISTISKRLVSLLSIQLPLYGPDSVNELMPTLLSYNKTLPDFNKYFVQTFDQDIEALILTDKKNIPKNIDYDLEESMISLLPNWIDFLNKSSNNPELDQINYKINEIAKIIGIKEFGEIGQIIEYNPLRHKIINSDTLLPIKVKVVKAGLVITSKDGLTRVALKSLVERFNDSQEI